MPLYYCFLWREHMQHGEHPSLFTVCLSMVARAHKVLEVPQAPARGPIALPLAARMGACCKAATRYTSDGHQMHVPTRIFHAARFVWRPQLSATSQRDRCSPGGYARNTPYYALYQLYHNRVRT